MSITTKILQDAAGIQYQGVQDKSEADPTLNNLNALFIGDFKRGRLDKPFIVTKENIRAKLGYDPNNLQYVAIEDALNSGAAYVCVIRAESMTDDIVVEPPAEELPPATEPEQPPVVTAPMPAAPLSISAMSPIRSGSAKSSYVPADGLSLLKALPVVVFFSPANVQEGDIMSLTSDDYNSLADSPFYTMAEKHFPISLADIENGYITCSFKPYRYPAGANGINFNGWPVTGNLKAKIIQKGSLQATATVTGPLSITPPIRLVGSQSWGTINHDISLIGSNVNFPVYRIKNNGDLFSFEMGSKSDTAGGGYSQRGYAWNAKDSYFEIQVESMPTAASTGKLYGVTGIPYPFIGLGERAIGMSMAYDSAVVDATAEFGILVAGNGFIYNKKTGATVAFAGRNLQAGDTIGVYVQMSNTIASFYLNGVWKANLPLSYRQEYINATQNRQATYTTPSIFIANDGSVVKLKLFKPDWLYSQDDYMPYI